jgi:hypothetical protein
MPKYKIDQALEEIGNEESEMTVEQNFDNLCQTILAQSYEICMRAKKKGVKIDEDDDYRQIQMVKQVRIISGIYAMLKRNGRIATKPNEHFDEQLLAKIKAQKGTIGDIVVSTQKQENGTQ